MHWARDHEITGTGVDISTVFTARAQASEPGVADRITFVHGDASGHVAEEPVDVAACIGATRTGGVAGTVRLLQSSPCPGGPILIGEPF